MPTIAEFLTVRLDADEETAQRATGPVHVDVTMGDREGYGRARVLFHRRFPPVRVLAEVAVKRERLRMYVEQQATLQDVYANPDRYLHDQQIAAAVSAGVLEYAVRQDAAIYATHPDYDPTWSLDAPH